MKKICAYQMVLLQMDSKPSLRWFLTLIVIPFFIPVESLKSIISPICFALLFIMEARQLSHSRTYISANIPASKRFELGNLYLHGIVIITLIYLVFLSIAIIIGLIAALVLLWQGDTSFLAVQSVQTLDDLTSTEVVPAMQSFFCFFTIYLIGISFMLLVRELKKQIAYLSCVVLVVIIITAHFHEVVQSNYGGLYMAILLGVSLLPFFTIHHITRKLNE